MAAFQQHLNATTTVFAFGLPDSNMHAPNENFRLSMYSLARKAWVHFLFELGKQATADSQQQAAAAADRSEL